MRGTKWIPVVLLGLLSQACTPMYKPAADEPTATIRVVGLGYPHLCKDDKRYTLPDAAGSKDGLQVPAGERITLITTIFKDAYRVHYFCWPSLSFIPSPGQTYVLNDALVGEGKCSIELVRESASEKNGLARERTMDRPVCKD